MTATEKELLYDLSIAVITLLEPHRVKGYDLTPSERSRNLTKLLQEMHDEDLSIAHAEECPNCGRPLGGSFPLCSGCQVVEALKVGDEPATVKCLDCGSQVRVGSPCERCGLGDDR